MSHTRTSSKEAILDAAVRVVLRDGLQALTLDGVAREAGLSKGGVLYHFGSKDALVAGMIDHYLREQEQDMERRQAADPRKKGSWLRAYLDTSFPEAPAGGLSESQTRQVHVALLAAVAVNPRLVGPVREYVDRWAERLEGDGLDELLLWLAIDGLWLWDLFGMLPADGELREQLIGRLRERTLEKRP